MATRKRTAGLPPRKPCARHAQPLAAGLPKGYSALLEDIKSSIRAAQIQAGLAVNRELIALYWQIGKEIVLRQEAEGWGTNVLNRLAKDLQAEFPGVAGFSRTNVYRMRAFFQAYAPEGPIVPQPVRQSGGSIVPQAVGQLDTAATPQPVLDIPWGHNVVLLEKLKDQAARLWYAQQTIAHGWSRNMLLHWIESDLYARQGKAVTNFRQTLPPPQSDLAMQIVKDPYSFDFLTLREDAAERELEQGLLDHIRRFLLELGAGFAFVGQQVHLEVEGEDFYIDLLFYHLRLRCFVVVDLKAQPFKPEFAGKMNFYLSAVDDLLRHPDDKPSIGLILCKSRKQIIAEYALRDLAKPVGVAGYVTKLVESLPARFKNALPSPQELALQMRKASRPSP